MPNSPVVGDVVADESAREEIIGAPSPDPVVVPLPENKLPIHYIERHIAGHCRRLELLRELVAYVPFLILFIFYELVGLQMEERYWLNSQIGGNLLTGVTSSKEAIWTLRPGEVAGYHVALSFDIIKNADEWHAWVQSVVVPQMYDAGQDSNSNQTDDISSRWIVGGNRPLGALRFRMLRVNGATCALNVGSLSSDALASVSFLQPQPGIGDGVCYNKYSNDRVNKSTLLLAPSLVPRRANVTSMPFRECDIVGGSDWGVHGVYSCGGNIFDVPVSLSMNESLLEVERLRNAFQQWIGDGALEESLIETRLAVVEFFTYTPALNLFSSFKSFTEVTIGGRIETYVQSQNFKLWTPHLAGYTVFFVIFMISVLLYSFALVRNVRRAARVGALWSQCLFSGWFFLDVANVLIFYAAFVVHIVWIAQSVSTNVQVWYPTLEQRDAYPQELEFVLFLYQMEQYFNATNTVLCFLKLIKFTSLHSDVSAVIGTLQRAKDTMLSVLIIFLLVVLAYAVAGTIVFGTFLPDDYSTVTKSFSSLLRLLVGDFDYESMRLVNGAIAGLFFWSFVILALFLMLSFIVGLLASEFGEERERIDESKKRTLQQEEHDKRLREEAGDAHHRPPSVSTRFKLWCKALRAAPKDTIQERFDVILLWMRAPRYMRRLERALVEYTAAEASKFTAATAGLDARVVAKKRKQLRRHRVTAERMIDIVTEYRKKPIPRSLVANFWTRATAEMSYDKEVCDDNADDVALQSMKDAVDHVLTDLFGLVAVGSRDGTLANAELEHYRSSKTLWNSIQDTAAAAPGGASTAADDTQAERTADGNGTSATESEGAQRRQQYSLNSTAAAHEALQVRDALLHEEQLQTQLRALDTMVSRLELCVLEAVIAVNLGPDALRQSNVPSPPTGRREPSEGHHAPF